MDDKLCGKSIPRLDVMAKLRGMARFVGDVSLPGMWHGTAVRSPVARGRIRNIIFRKDFDWSRVVVATAKDIPGKNVVSIIEQDMPCLAWDRVEYKGEPIVLVAAPTQNLLEEAAAAVKVEVEPEPPLFGIERIVSAYKSQNASLEFLHSLQIDKGDPARGFAEADEIVEGEYFTGLQEHVYLEPQGILASPHEEGVKILGSLQCPYYVQPAVALVLGVANEKVIVEHAPTGGAFGGKEDYPSLLASYAALLALKANRPVRMLLKRDEDIAFTTKRHPSWTRLKVGVKKNGTITALEGEFLLDGGAFITLSPVVLSRGAIHLSGAYQCPNVLIRAKVVKSNIPPTGAFRGFGVPQAMFAIESHMDEVSRRLGFDPVRYRLENAFKEGDITATGQRLKESVAVRDCLEAVIRACGYEARLREIEKFNNTGGNEKKGLGCALFWHGGGFTGGGEVKLASKAALELHGDGTVEILVSITEMGQGAFTSLRQIVADGCGIPIHKVRFPSPSTSRVPNTGPTVASRATQVVGKILEKCSHDLIAQIRRRAGLKPGGKFHWDEGVKAALGEGPLVVESQYEPLPGIEWDEEKHKGDAYASYSWGAVIVEVSVDRVTYSVTPDKVWCAVEIGKAINPLGAEAQVQGGLAQALGYGILEQLTITEEGAILENRFRDYIVPVSVDMPRLNVEILERPFSGGPLGAKGLGELPMDGLAPALRNAIAHAVGLSINSLPVTPEKIVTAVLQARGGEKHE